MWFLTSAIALLFFLLIMVQRRAARTRRSSPFQGRESKYAGMNTNERLVAAGLFRRFQAAARSRDFDALVAVLQMVEIPHGDACGIAQRIVADPAKFGY
jgi:hypothetical protein